MSLWKDIMKICEGILWIITIQYGREINFLYSVFKFWKIVPGIMSFDNVLRLIICCAAMINDEYREMITYVCV